MKLPDNSPKIIEAFSGLTAERKAEICKHLAETPDAQGMATVKQILTNGGPEAEFVSKVFDMPLPAPTDAPANKAQTAPNRK